MTSPTSTDAVALLVGLARAVREMLIGIEVHNGLNPDAPARKTDVAGPTVDALNNAYRETMNWLYAIAEQPAEAVEAQKDQLCALIFNNVEASVDYVAGEPIAVLSEVASAATAVLNAGFRKHALRTRIEAEDRSRAALEAKQ